MLLRERDLGDFEGIDYRIYFSKFEEKNDVKTRDIKTGKGGESLNEVLQRGIKILNLLIQKYINPNIIINIKNEEIKSYKDISYEEFCDDFKKGNLKIKEEINLNKIILVTHCVLIKEFLNIILILWKKEYLRWIETHNTCIFKIKIFCEICKGKCQKSNQHNIKDLSYSIDSINDYSHLN